MGPTMLLYVMISYAFTYSLPLTRTSSACYSSGGDCGFHFLSCDQGQEISLRSMYYGYKDPYSYTRNECSAILTDCAGFVHKTACCRHNVSMGCLKPYYPEHLTHAEEICNGKKQCVFHATYADGGCRKPPYVFRDVSSYSVIRYICVNVTTTSSPVTVTTAVAGCDSCEKATLQTTVNNSATSVPNHEGVLPLVVGVSVGLGCGLISLLVISTLCWLRIRRKPSAARSPSSETRTRSAPTSAQRSLSTRTVSSSLPSSSLYSSTFLSTDSLSSSTQHGSGQRGGQSVRLSRRDQHVAHFSNHGYDSDGVAGSSVDWHQCTRRRSDGPDGDREEAVPGDLPPELQDTVARSLTLQRRTAQQDNGVILSPSSLHLDSEVNRHGIGWKTVGLLRLAERDKTAGRYEQALALSGNTGLQITFSSPEENESKDFTEQRGDDVSIQEATAEEYGEVRNGTHTVRLTSERREYTATGECRRHFHTSSHVLYAMPSNIRSKQPPNIRAPMYVAGQNPDQLLEEQKLTKSADMTGWISTDNVAQPRSTKNSYHFSSCPQDP